MLLGLPFAMEYVVRPGDTLTQIAKQHRTTVTKIVKRNDLHPSGDRVIAGQTLRIPAAHGRGTGTPRTQQSKPRAAQSASRIDPDARRIVHYRVRPGDTPSGLAVRFHAWTAELIELNGPVLRVGERIRIPVVLAAAARDRKSSSAKTRSAPSRKTRSHQATPARTRARTARPGDPSRATVRRIIERTARRHGVDPQLALAVSWQEAGWQMHHVSYANAIGAMQVIPSTGAWMSDIVGRRLDLRDVHDNVTAGVVLLKVLQQAAPQRVAIAGYYQGLAGVREHGMFSDTKRYVANVLALKHRFERGQYPG